MGTTHGKPSRFARRARPNPIGNIDRAAWSVVRRPDRLGFRGLDCLDGHAPDASDLKPDRTLFTPIATAASRRLSNRRSVNRREKKPGALRRPRFTVRQLSRRQACPLASRDIRRIWQEKRRGPCCSRRNWLGQGPIRRWRNLDRRQLFGAVQRRGQCPIEREFPALALRPAVPRHSARLVKIKLWLRFNRLCSWHNRGPVSLRVRFWGTRGIDRHAGAGHQLFRRPIHLPCVEIDDRR